MCGFFLLSHVWLCRLGSGDTVYKAVSNESTAHIQRLVGNQKSAKKRPGRGRGGIRGRGGTFSRGMSRGGRGGRGVSTGYRERKRPNICSFKFHAVNVQKIIVWFVLKKKTK